jgi:hypothetical protein
MARSLSGNWRASFSMIAASIRKQTSSTRPRRQSSIEVHPYSARHQIRLDPEAHDARHTHHSEDGLTIHQTLIDPEDLNDWSLHLTLDLEKSKNQPSSDGVMKISRNSPEHRQEYPQRPATPHAFRHS